MIKGHGNVRKCNGNGVRRLQKLKVYRIHFFNVEFRGIAWIYQVFCQYPVAINPYSKYGSLCGSLYRRCR